MALQVKREIKRQIGQILIDGGFLKKNNLVLACEEQKHTHELLGQVLVRMGVLKEQYIKAPLLIQDRLSSIDDAVRTAAGERRLLGALLVESGKITNKQLDAAIAEQKRTGEKLGEVFTRLGMLTERQLTALIEFQHNQTDTTIINPLRLGELLVATGYISREQLEDALRKQSITHKRIGEVLVEEGYLSSRKLQSVFRLQNMLVKSALAAILSLGLGAPAMASNASLQWDPVAAPGLAGYKVYYSDVATPLEAATPIDVGKLTTASISGLDPAKSYEFAVTAYDTAGTESSFSNVVTLQELAPPSVGITSPLNSASVSGVVTVSVNASDNVGVTKVEFYVNGLLKGTDTASPYAFSWDTTSLAAGTYTLMAKAYDAAGNVNQSSSTVNVVKDTIAPAVTMTSPANNATLSGTVTVSSSASDNVGVTLVEFYSNGVLLYASNVAPYNYNWDTTKVANGNYSLYSIAKDNAGNTKQSSSVTVTVNNAVPDTVAPTLTGFTLPATSNSLTVPVSGLTATDNIGVTGYLVSESATKPLAGDTRWRSSVPPSITFGSAGTKTAYAWVKDAAGNVSASRSAAVVITLADVTAPTLTGFTLPATSSSLTVPVSGLTATDNIGVTGYLVSESATKPLAGDTRWSGSVPSGITFGSAGTKTAYAWVKDAAGNVSASRSATVVITLPDATAPTLTGFTLPATSSSLTVPVSGLSATDNIGVTGYLVSESATRPLPSDTRWSSAAPASFTFSSAGTKTAYAWAKDAAGNVSASRSATVVINIPTVAAGTIVFADNSGGAQFKDSTGTVYLADSKYTGGSLGKTTSGISGTSDDSIYQTERYGNFAYNIPVANGNYNVTLKFAEIYFNAAGKRIFSVKINGQTVITDLDIYTKVGKNRAYDLVIPASVTNGTLKIEFVSKVNNATVSGILVKTR